MKYFIPNWEDRLDEFYDFVYDCYSPGRTMPSEQDVYAHNIYKESTPYDGIIMSLNIFGDKIQVNGKAEIKGYEGRSIRDYLKTHSINKNLNLMCDCGAFSYIDEEKPPEKYTVEYISKIYNMLEFDFGVSVDHLINKKLSKEENETRRELSTNNAIDFYKYWREKQERLSYIPVGSAQGYDITGYKKSVISLIDAGYKHIGLGTLIPRSDEFIVELLEEIYPLIKKAKINLHLFGILRKDYLKKFENLGAKSFDSASYLRKAWLRSDNNYLGTDLNWYSAIRVPILGGEKNLNELKKKGFDVSKLKKEETEILKMLHEYDLEEIKTTDELVKKIVKYDKTLIRSYENSEKYEERYRQVLESKIWKKCNCEMCQQAGIHIIVFRRANRNKRRGFHNTWVFYHNYMK